MSFTSIGLINELANELVGSVYRASLTVVVVLIRASQASCAVTGAIICEATTLAIFGYWGRSGECKDLLTSFLCNRNYVGRWVGAWLAGEDRSIDNEDIVSAPDTSIGIHHGGSTSETGVCAYLRCAHPVVGATGSGSEGILQVVY